MSTICYFLDPLDTDLIIIIMTRFEISVFIAMSKHVISFSMSILSPPDMQINERTN